MNDKSEEKKEEKLKEKVDIDLSKPGNLFNLVYNTKKPDDTKPIIAKYLKSLIDKFPSKDKYNILFLYDDIGQIDRYTSNQIYSALSARENNKDKALLLILYSSGGLVESAYLISKCCQEYCKKFVVVIPRQAKSAATLLAMGADEIHMGLMSELGPIDPQIGTYPALGLGYAVEYLASLCKRYPESSNMFARYLSLSLDLTHLGYLERVSESAAQYAERLLKNKKLPSEQSPASVASRLVYSYKDHRFVIDRKEAETFLGTDFVKHDTEEYKIADSIHKSLEEITLAFRVFKKINFSIVGGLDLGIQLIRRRDKEPP